MLNDVFRIKYKTIPFAVSIQNDTMCDTALHNHIEFEILRIIKGNPLVCVGDKEYNVKPGDMIFINPMEIHSVKNIHSEKFSLQCICFDMSLIIDKKTADEIKSEKQLIKHFIPKEYEFMDKLTSYFENIISVYEENGVYSDMEISAFLSLIFSILLKNDMTYNEYKKSKNTIFCANVISYIAQNYSEDISSADAASALAYNHSYFCRHFKRNFGKCFFEYLNIYRISMSRKFLEEGNMNITQVAQKCGFNSNVYFSRCFKKHVGVPPSEYKS